MVPDLPAMKSPARVGRSVPHFAGPLTALFVWCLALLFIGLSGSPDTTSAPPQVLAGETVRVAPGESIQSAIDAAGPGATVVVGTGVHRGQSITPLNDMVVRGEVGAVLDGTGAPLPYAIYGDAANVTIADLEIRNYTKPIWGPNNYRHQGAIHGASMNAGGGVIAIASNWKIEDNDIHSNAGWGVSPGDGFHIVDNALHHNGMTGIGGGDFNYETGRPWDWAWNAATARCARTSFETRAAAATI